MAGTPANCAQRVFRAGKHLKIVLAASGAPREARRPGPWAEPKSGETSRGTSECRCLWIALPGGESQIPRRWTCLWIAVPGGAAGSRWQPWVHPVRDTRGQSWFVGSVGPWRGRQSAGGWVVGFVEAGGVTWGRRARQPSRLSRVARSPSTVLNPGAQNRWSPAPGGAEQASSLSQERRSLLRQHATAHALAVAEPVVPSSWRCRTSVFVVTGETLTPPATRDCTCPGSFGKHGPGDHATQNPDLSAPHSWQSVRRLRNNGLHTCTNARGCRAPDAPSQHCRMTRHPALPSRRICRAC